MPVVYKNNLPDKIRRGIGKFGKITGRSIAFMASIIAMAGGTIAFPPLVIPTGALALYTSQRLLNETLYKSYKDIAFIARRHGKNMKIYQDVLRPDIFTETRQMDVREKLGFLQLQTIAGMSKFGSLDEKGKPLTLETDTHGMVRKTIQKLTEMGYIQNYSETYLRQSTLLLPKLAFANKDIGKKTDVYNIRFQRTDKPIDLEDENLRRLFPMVFSKRGIISNMRL